MYDTLMLVYYTYSLSILQESILDPEDCMGMWSSVRLLCCLVSSLRRLDMEHHLVRRRLLQAQTQR